MTDRQFDRVRRAFGAYLETFRPHLGEVRVAAHFQTYCRGLISDEPRKTVEPIALRAGTTVRALQVFLKDGVWDHAGVAHTLRRHLATAVAAEPDPDRLGTIGLIDETSVLKQGTKTPGVQRQYLGCVGKVANGIVTVHLGVARGDLHALLDADLFLPRSWANDRPRCEAAGIPADLGHRPKWKIAFWQVVRARKAGFAFDWLVFDEGYGRVGAFLKVLDVIGQRYVGEIPVNFRVAVRSDGPRQEVRKVLPATARTGWERLRVHQRTGGVAIWKYRSKVVEGAKHRQRVVVAVNVRTKEVKYFASNAVDRSARTVLRAGLRRAPIESLFRLAKQEAGMGHFEGRNYQALVRHLTLALVVLGFVGTHTARLRKKTAR